jgi:hypothetical protein
MCCLGGEELPQSRSLLVRHEDLRLLWTFVPSLLTL